MLTIFTTPKAFTGHFAIIQRNAIRSWLKICPECRIILFGNDPGTEDAAKDLGVNHVPEIACNERGTPMVNSIFKTAQSDDKYELLAYVNADIILMGDFIDTICRIKREKFLAVGRRYDLDINFEFDFDDFEWESKLQSDINGRGILHGNSGIDYFVFNRGLFKNIPAFALGRTAWDNWLIYYTRRKHIPIIDITRSVTAVHQNHSFPSSFVRIEGTPWKGEEAKRNLELAGGVKHCYDLLDVTHVLDKKSLRLAWDYPHLRRRIRRLLTR